jgi:hypothetical protein
LDASGGSVFRIKRDAAEGVLIRAAASTQTLAVFRFQWRKKLIRELKSLLPGIICRSAVLCAMSVAQAFLNSQTLPNQMSSESVSLFVMEGT